MLFESASPKTLWLRYKNIKKFTKNKISLSNRGENRYLRVYPLILRLQHPSALLYNLRLHLGLYRCASGWYRVVQYHLWLHISVSRCYNLTSGYTEVLQGGTICMGRHIGSWLCTLEIWAVVLLLSESRALINDLYVMLHGFMLQIIYTTIFRVNRLNNRKTVVYIFNVLNKYITISYIFSRHWTWQLNNKSIIFVIRIL